MFSSVVIANTSACSQVPDATWVRVDQIRHHGAAAAVQDHRTRRAG
ncbi:MAG: hypothetical protein JO281_20605 [Pseudonocardiales bacterium]|nr:hypothetical protein [Pseudonocardiales bacterium]